MNRAGKKCEFVHVAERGCSRHRFFVVVAHYAGLTVAADERLSFEMREAEPGTVKVAKNRLAKNPALQGAPFEGNPGICSRDRP